MSHLIINPKETYTEEEIKATEAAWLSLRNEFELIRKDKREKEQRKIICKKSELEVREDIIGMLCFSLNLIYSPIIIDKLRYYHPDLKFTKETYLQDIKIIGNKEVRNKEHIQDLKKIVEQDGIISGDNQTSDDSIRSYINSYNRAFRTEFSIRKLYADEYASICYDYDKYVADLKKEYDKTRPKR